MKHKGVSEKELDVKTSINNLYKDLCGLRETFPILIALMVIRHRKGKGKSVGTVELEYEYKTVSIQFQRLSLKEGKLTVHGPVTREYRVTCSNHSNTYEITDEVKGWVKKIKKIMASKY